MGTNPSAGSAPQSGPTHDLLLTRASALKVATEYGWDEFLAAVERKATYAFGWAPDLYSVSTEWISDPSITTVKARGANGDVLIWLV